MVEFFRISRHEAEVESRFCYASDGRLIRLRMFRAFAGSWRQIRMRKLPRSWRRIRIGKEALQPIPRLHRRQPGLFSRLRAQAHPASVAISTSCEGGHGILVIQNPCNKGTGERQQVIARRSQEPAGFVLPWCQRLSRRARGHPRTAPEKNHTGASIRIPARTKTVQINHTAHPVLAVSAAPFTTLFFSRQALHTHSQKQTPVRVPRIASPEKHLLHQSIRQVTQEGSTAGCRAISMEH